MQNYYIKYPKKANFPSTFTTGYSSIGEPQKISLYPVGRKRQFYNFYNIKWNIFDSRKIINNLV